MIFGGIGERRSRVATHEKQRGDGWLYVIHVVGASLMAAAVWFASVRPWH